MEHLERFGNSKAVKLCRWNSLLWGQFCFRNCHVCLSSPERSHLSLRLIHSRYKSLHSTRHVYSCIRIGFVNRACRALSSSTQLIINVLFRACIFFARFSALRVLPAETRIDGLPPALCLTYSRWFWYVSIFWKTEQQKPTNNSINREFYVN